MLTHADDRDVPLFQFLIGTIKTLPTPETIGPNSMFQFLIGTIKTEQRLAQRDGYVLVSIPHRYDQNA